MFAPDGVNSSLVFNQLIGGGVDSAFRPSWCGNPRADRALLDAGTGELRPVACRRNGCGVCGPINAYWVAGAIAQARPDRLITLTLVGDAWQQIRARMRDLARDLRRAVPAFSWCWHVEPNPGGTGHHVHALQYGSFVPQRRLAQFADGAGMGRVADIRRVTARDAASHYGLKMAAAAYGLKLAREQQAELDGYLECNGGRLVHASRGFWRDENGRRVPGVRDAVQRVRKRVLGALESEWRVVRRPGITWEWPVVARGTGGTA